MCLIVDIKTREMFSTQNGQCQIKEGRGYKNAHFLYGGDEI